MPSPLETRTWMVYATPATTACQDHRHQHPQNRAWVEFAGPDTTVPRDPLRRQIVPEDMHAPMGRALRALARLATGAVAIRTRRHRIALSMKTARLLLMNALPDTIVKRAQQSRYHVPLAHSRLLGVSPMPRIAPFASAGGCARTMQPIDSHKSARQGTFAGLVRSFLLSNAPLVTSAMWASLNLRRVCQERTKTQRNNQIVWSVQKDIIASLRPNPMLLVHQAITAQAARDFAGSFHAREARTTTGRGSQQKLNVNRAVQAHIVRQRVFQPLPANVRRGSSASLARKQRCLEVTAIT